MFTNNSRSKIKIEIKSAGFETGNYASIKINGVKIFLLSNHNNHYRGLSIVIINPDNGKIELA